MIKGQYNKIKMELLLYLEENILYAVHSYLNARFYYWILILLYAQ